MDLSLAGVAETLATEFPGLLGGTVVAVVTECADTLPRADPFFVEQAARARLRVRARVEARRGGIPSAVPPQRDDDRLAVQRADLAAELELIERLMCACRDFEGAVPQPDIDRALGLVGMARMRSMGPPAFPGHLPRALPPLPPG